MGKVMSLLRGVMPSNSTNSDSPAPAPVVKNKDPAGYKLFAFVPSEAAYEAPLMSKSEGSLKRKRVEVSRSATDIQGSGIFMDVACMDFYLFKNTESTAKLLLPLMSYTLCELTAEDVDQVFAAINLIKQGTPSGHDVMDHGTSSCQDSIVYGTPSCHYDTDIGSDGRPLAPVNDVDSRGVGPVFVRPWTLGVEISNNVAPGGLSETMPAIVTSSQTNQPPDHASDPEMTTPDQINVSGSRASETDADHNPGINSDDQVPNTTELPEEIVIDDEIDSPLPLPLCRKIVLSIMEDLKYSKQFDNQDTINAELDTSVPHQNPGTSSNQADIWEHTALNFQDQDSQVDDPTFNISNGSEQNSLEDVKPIISDLNGSRGSSRKTRAKKRSRQEQEQEDATVLFMDSEGNHVFVRRCCRTWKLELDGISH